MELKEGIVNLLLAAIMIICAVVDIKKKEIPVWIFVVLGVTALTGSICGGGYGLYKMAAGVIPGILLLGLARITEQSIGYGDGIILAEIGCMTGAGICTIILAGALALAGIFSMGMLIVKRVDKRYRIPFIPFLTTVYIIVVCLQGRQV